MSEKVARLATRSHDALREDIQLLLRQVIDDIATGEKAHTCAMVILLDNRNDQFNVSYKATGMRNSEGIAAMRIIERQILDEMLGVGQ